jgi:hypothetical protein
MSAAERVYRLLLRAYPAGFRAAYGQEMLLVFRDQRRERGATGARFWAEVVWDVARSAPALRLEAMRGHGVTDMHSGEGTMKTMAILTMLIGALEAVSALVEGWAGGFANGNGYWLAGVVLTVVAGGMLLAAGIAMLRRTSGAAAWARGAAITCLAVVVLIRLVQPWMGIFWMLLGIAFPIALLLFLGWTRGRGPSAPTMA